MLRLITDESAAVVPLGKLIAAADMDNAFANELRDDRRSTGKHAGLNSGSSRFIGNALQPALPDLCGFLAEVDRQETNAVSSYGHGVVDIRAPIEYYEQQHIVGTVMRGLAVPGL